MFTKNFDSTFKAIQDKVYWEEIPEKLISRVIPLTKSEHIPVLIKALEAYTPKVMKDDAGDIADERYRMSATVEMILMGLDFAFEEELILHLPKSLPFTQKFILDIMGKRKFLLAYTSIQQLQKQTKSKSVRLKCQETLTLLGF